MSQPAACIRPMRVDDLVRVIDIARTLPEAPQWPASAYRTAIESRISSEPMLHRLALVAEIPETGTIAAFAVASLLPPQAELETIAVTPEHQRRGLARQLMTALTAKLRQMGARELFLEVRASNSPALGLYHALGFTETGCRPRYYTHPVEDAMLMTLPLT